MSKRTLIAILIQQMIYNFNINNELNEDTIHNFIRIQTELLKSNNVATLEHWINETFEIHPIIEKSFQKDITEQPKNYIK